MGEMLGLFLSCQQVCWIFSLFYTKGYTFEADGKQVCNTRVCVRVNVCVGVRVWVLTSSVNGCMRGACVSMSASAWCVYVVFQWCFRRLCVHVSVL
jgi:hypothetical protein